MSMNKIAIALVPILLTVSACGTSKSMVSSRYEKMETWQLCKQILENDMARWKIPWANEVIKKRGESCEPYIGKFSPPQRKYMGSGSSKTNSMDVWKKNEIERKQKKLERKQQEIEQNMRREKLERDLNCSNYSWRKGLC
jgi:hypothetical protein